MSIYRRRNASGALGHWWVDVRWRGIPRIQASTGSDSKSRAKAIQATLHALRDAGRLDILGLVTNGHLSLAQVHMAWIRDPSTLSHAVARAESPTLGTLADEWLESLDTPGALSPRTKRPYSPKATQRYRVSINSVFATLANGRETRAADLTRGALVAFRDARRKHVTGSSINRDLSALQALRRWCADNKGIRFADFSMPKERENSARYRWLTREEIECWQKTIPADWRIFFGILLNTGMRVGEALGLTWGDVYLSESRITIGGSARVKTMASHRDVPINSTLARLLALHAKQVPSHASDSVFPQPQYRYAAARAVLKASRTAAEVRDFTMHDLRHTFAVHAIQASVPIPRLQRQLGHASPVMTLRYAAHAPEAYFAQDAAAVDQALNGVANTVQTGENSGENSDVGQNKIGENSSVAVAPMLRRA